MPSPAPRMRTGVPATRSIPASITKMAIVVPRKRHGLALLESRLTPDMVSKWFDGEAQYEHLDVRLPRFKVEPPGITRLMRDIRAALYDIPLGGPVVGYCFGDGTGNACPCGVGGAGHGCPSSVNPFARYCATTFFSK